MSGPMGELDGGDDRRHDDDRPVVLHLDDRQVEGASDSEAGLEEELSGEG